MEIINPNITKNAFQKLSKTLRYQKMYLETKKRVLYYNVIFYLVLNTRKIPQRLKKERDVFLRQNIANMMDRGIFKENKNYKETDANNQKETSKIYWHKMRKQGLVNLTLIGHAESKRNLRKHQVIYIWGEV